jgi:hypothetical protein
MLMPEARFASILRANLYARSPFDIGIYKNFCMVLGDNPLSWFIPVSWGVRQRPPYTFSHVFTALKAIAYERLRFRENKDHLDRVMAVEAEWYRRNQPAHAFRVLAAAAALTET